MEPSDAGEQDGTDGSVRRGASLGSYRITIEVDRRDGSQITLDESAFLVTAHGDLVILDCLGKPVQSLARGTWRGVRRVVR